MEMYIILYKNQMVCEIHRSSLKSQLNHEATEDHEAHKKGCGIFPGHRIPLLDDSIVGEAIKYLTSMLFMLPHGHLQPLDSGSLAICGIWFGSYVHDEGRVSPMPAAFQIAPNAISNTTSIIQ